MGKENNQTKTGAVGVRFSLIAKITALAVVPIVVLGVVLAVVGLKSIESGMEQEVLNGLDAEVQALQGAMEEVAEGEYVLKDDKLYKGDYCFTDNEDKLDVFVEGNDIEVTLIYGKTRYATTLTDDTTGERMVGTDVSDAVYETVVKNGQKFSNNNVQIKNQRFYTVYHPMKNGNEVVGMFFAGRPAANVESFVMSKASAMVIVAVVIVIVSIIVVMIGVFAINKVLAKTGEMLGKISQGDLTIEAPEKLLKRNDELGDMARGIHSLMEELKGVLGNVQKAAGALNEAGRELSSMASQTSTTADEISHAVEDISKGAVSQAEEIENASADITEMGGVIEQIVNSVANLDGTSGQMKEAGDSSTAIIRDLSISNDRTMEAIGRIGEQVHATNESANKISEAIQLITSIAEETNLLSLNASIEAARAGEQGRGFAVVANQIQKLAEQSNESAQKVSEIIENLLKDSEKTVTVMEDVRKIVDEQQEKLNQTRKEFTNVQNGIDESREETSEIKDQTDECDSARVRVVDVISNLSAISQENAAATQQTTASMQELNATINLLAESAGDLEQLSDTLSEQIAFFKI